MWRFSIFYNGIHICIYQISIHPMWRFSKSTIKEVKPLEKFQYIQCEGSANYEPDKKQLNLLFQYIQCEGSAYIKERNCFFITIFQYIQCEGSAGIMSLLPHMAITFQYIQCEGSAWNCKEIYWRYRTISIHPMWRFSTTFWTSVRFDAVISIHPMWRFSKPLSVKEIC